MKLSRIGMILLCTIAVAAQAAPARADVVTDWNAITFQIGGPSIQRTLAMVHVAIFDAVNSIERRYAPYHSLIDVASGASAEAAAAAAARGVLIRRFPAQALLLDAALAASVSGIPDGPGKSDGLALGDQVAAEIHAFRVNDHILTPGPAYTPLTGPGTYQLTPPNFTAPANTGAASWAPFALTSADQFRPNGPLSLTHPRYFDDFEEVRNIGAVNSPRTADQTLSALWYIELPYSAMNRIARAQAQDLDLLTDARFFALLNIAMADATMSVFEAKYTFNFWRPVTAIRGAATDENLKTTADPTWTPLLDSPAHPEYPSAHSVIDTAAIQVLESVFGQNHVFSTTSTSVPGVVRTFNSFRDYGEDAAWARIYGGIHFRAAVVEGTRQGKKIGNWVLENCLLPQ